MSTLRFPNYISVGAAIVALGVTAPVQAQLGATVHPADPSQGDVVRQAQGGLVTYRETTDANGIVSRQYVDSTGKVYAVSWHGPAMPNVQALLGAYFATFKDGANATVGEAGLHTARVAEGDLVVENRLRLREFSGRAWLVSALPRGVSVSDIQ